MAPKTVTTIHVSERLDAASADGFRRQIHAAVTDAHAVIVDFSTTRFVDSTGLGALIGLLKSCDHRGTSVVLAGLSPQVRQIFELTRLYKLFDIFETVSQAEAALESGTV